MHSIGAEALRRTPEEAMDSKGLLGTQSRCRQRDFPLPLREGKRPLKPAFSFNSPRTLRLPLTYDALLGLPKIQATRIEITYNPSMGAAKSIMFGISLVGETIAATIRITITEVFQTRTRKPADTNPIRARMYVIAGI